MLEDIKVSVVMPCLNEEKNIGICIEKAKKSLEENSIHGEIIVVDNGSMDLSAKIAESLGAKVINQPVRGYGSAYIKGFSEAKGKYIFMADSDNTYDFGEIGRFVKYLDEGYDFVIGNRFKGKIYSGAMPWLHKYIGNPILSGILKFMFKVKINDSHCGMRAFRRDLLSSLNLSTTGMEFASEMVIKTGKLGIKIKELPIDYFERIGESKLRSLPDGWRHLRFMLLLSPNYLFLLPGFIMFIFGLISLMFLVKGPIIIFKHNFDLHMMIFTSFFTISGLQILSLGIFTQVYSHNLFSINNKFITLLLKRFTLERGIYLGVFLLLIGFFFCLKVFYNYIYSVIGDSIYHDARLAVFGVTMMISGFQILFSSFYMSFLGIKKDQ